MNETTPGRIPGRSPAPTRLTTRTTTIGTSWRSTKSTRTPLAIDHVSIRGGAHTTAAAGAGAFSRKGASGVTRGAVRTGSAGTGAGADGCTEDGRGDPGPHAERATSTAIRFNCRFVFWFKASPAAPSA